MKTITRQRRMRRPKHCADKAKLPIARWDNPATNTITFGFNDKRYYLPKFEQIEVHDKKVYGYEGTREWLLGDILNGYTLEGQRYGQVIFKRMT